MSTPLFLRRSKIRSWANELIERFAVPTNRPGLNVAALAALARAPRATANLRAELADAAVTDAEPEAEAADDAGDAADQPADEPQAEASPAAANDEPEAGRPKRRGWWSLG